MEEIKPGAVLDRIDDIDRLDRIGRRTFGLDETGSGSGMRISIYGGQIAIVEQSKPTAEQV